VANIKLLQGRNSEQFAFEAEAEERDGRIVETVHVERLDALRRAARLGERDVALQQFANVFGSRVVNRDLALRHSRNLRDPDRSIPHRARTISRASASSTSAIGRIAEATRLQRHDLATGGDSLVRDPSDVLSHGLGRREAQWAMTSHEPRCRRPRQRRGDEQQDPAQNRVSLAARGPLPSAQLGSFALATEVLVATRKQVFDIGRILDGDIL
jgi:hypothetical protein